MSVDKVHINNGDSTPICSPHCQGLPWARLRSIWGFEHAHKQCKRCKKMLEENHPVIGLIQLREHEEERARKAKYAEFRRRLFPRSASKIVKKNKP